MYNYVYEVWYKLVSSIYDYVYVVWYKTIPSLYNYKKCTCIGLTLQKENKSHRKMLSKGKHYCDAKVSTFYVWKKYRITKHIWDINCLCE